MPVTDHGFLQALHLLSLWKVVVWMERRAEVTLIWVSAEHAI